MRPFFCACFWMIALVLYPLAAQAALIRDAEIENTLRLYAEPVFKAAGVTPSSVEIFIVNDDSLNAFVAGGANMFIHTGLILATDTPDMLIGVMAHETGHIAGGHLAQGTEKLKGAQIGSILTFVLGAAVAAASRKPEGAAAVIAGDQSSIARNFFAFTRANEEAADQSALNSLDALNISAGGFLKLFGLLQRNERLHSNNPDPYLLTHPLSRSRIEHVRNHIDTSPIPEGQYPKKFDILHKRMLAKLYGFLQTPEQTMLKYPAGDKSLPARMARAIAYYKMPDLERSLKEMDSLIAEHKDDAFLHELKGQILFENAKPAEALSSYQTAAKLLPSAPLILTDLAKVELEQADKNHVGSAIAHLEKSIRLDKHNGQSWRLLAIAYGKAGNKGMAALALSEQAMLRNDPDTALRQIETALSSLKPSTSAYQQALDLKAQAIELKRETEEQSSPF
jgi:predicted Zn-dependent protease